MKSGLTQLLLFVTLFLFFGSAYFYVGSYPLIGTILLLSSFPPIFILIGLNVPFAIKRLQTMLTVLREVEEKYSSSSAKTEEYNPSSLGPNWINHSDEKNSQQTEETAKENTNPFTETTYRTKTSQQTRSRNRTHQRKQKRTSSSTARSTPVQTATREKQLARKRLGLSENFTQDELESIYRSQVKEKHPDTETGSSEEFKQLQDDYELLSE